jgi:hypothetical protein
MVMGSAHSIGSSLKDKPRILIANDNIPVLNNLKIRFQSSFEVETADNGFVAL